MLALALLAQLQLAATPTVSIGVADGDTLQTLGNVLNVTEDRHGNLYLIQQATPYVAVFDSDGRRIATLGRGGGGPGEFSAPIRVSIVNDSVWVSDGALFKLTLFDPSLRYVRDIVYTADFLPHAERVHQIFGPSRQAPVDVGTDGFTLDVIAAEISATMYVPWAGELFEVARNPRYERQAMVRVDRHLFYTFPPIPVNPITVGHPAGVLRVQRGAELTLTALTATGSVAWETKADVEDAPVPRWFADSIVDAWTERWKSAAPSVSRARMREAVRDALGIPERSFFIKAARPDPSGEVVWLQQDRPRSPTRWLEVVRDGRVRRTLQLRMGQKLMALAETYAWVLEHDSDDVPYLRRYDIERR